MPHQTFRTPRKENTPNAVANGRTPQRMVLFGKKKYYDIVNDWDIEVAMSVVALISMSASKQVKNI